MKGPKEKPLAGAGQARQQGPEIKAGSLYTQDNSPAHSGQGEASPENSAAAQRQRILAWLQSAPLTTLQARQHLDILHPAARVMELRRLGYDIETIWVEDLSQAGKFHRVARYILRRV